MIIKKKNIYVTRVLLNHRFNQSVWILPPSLKDFTFYLSRLARYKVRMHSASCSFLQSDFKRHLCVPVYFILKPSLISLFAELMLLQIVCLHTMYTFPRYNLNAVIMRIIVFAYDIMIIILLLLWRIWPKFFYFRVFILIMSPKSWVVSSSHWSNKRGKY